ncbi:MAG: type I 3-dehydroquinate dehydratase [Candidatus Thorarchaeota archaeon]|jgi:3-dehydroquinate dehydratase-1
MKMKLCVSLTEKAASKCLEFVRSSDAEVIEHRLDFMERIEELHEIYGQSDTPIIVTCRSHTNGGHYKGSEKTRVGYLLEAISAGASYVDTGIETEPTLLNHVRQEASNAGCSLIVSKHYHDTTPDDSELSAMLDRLWSSGADIAKIATTPSTLDDCRRVLKLYSLGNPKESSLVAFAMGALGRITRVYALFLGAPFMYVSMDQGEAAAPGQLSLSQMRAVLEVLT